MRDFIRLVETKGADPKPVSESVTVLGLIDELESGLSRVRAAAGSSKQPFWVENGLRSALDGIEGIATYLEQTRKD